MALLSSESSNKLFHWITTCVPPSHPLSRRTPIGELHEEIVNGNKNHSRDTVKKTDTRTKASVCALHICVSSASYLFPKLEDEISLKKQSPAAFSAQPDCFMDSSHVWLPQPALSPLVALWSDAKNRKPITDLSACNGPREKIALSQS